MTYVRTHPLSVLPAHDYTLTTEDVEAEGIPFTTHTHIPSLGLHQEQQFQPKFFPTAVAVLICQLQGDS